MTFSPRCLMWILAATLSSASLGLVPLATAAEPHFVAQTIDDDIQIGYGLAHGRVDADDHIDVLLADKSEIVWYQNPGVAGEAWRRHVIARNLTTRDNVCIAARDITGDGLVEIAVGANWNPGETSDRSTSGALFYLQRPDDPRGAWRPVVISAHDPTTHRMHWRKTSDGYLLSVLPLHGVGNEGGEGQTVSLAEYRVVSDEEVGLHRRIDTTMHMTHNFDLVEGDPGESEMLVVAGKEGLMRVVGASVAPLIDTSVSRGAGEVRVYPSDEGRALAAIEPMHGNDVVLYREGESSAWRREVLDSTLAAGHALAAVDFLGAGRAQVAAGWRSRDQNGKVGIKLYVPRDGGWSTHIVDDNTMACEDLKAVDLDADGKPDIVAAGRATQNVVVYWNRSE